MLLCHLLIIVRMASERKIPSLINGNKGPFTTTLLSRATQGNSSRHFSRRIIFSFSTSSIITLFLILVPYVKRQKHVGNRILSFELCNGYGNQVISFLHGTAIALETRRDIILPRFILDGTQMNATIRHVKNSKSIAFNRVVNFGLLKSALRGSITLIPEDQGINLQFKYFNYSFFDESFIRISSNTANVAIGCPAFRVNKTLVYKHRHILRLILQSLRPTERYLRIAESFLQDKGIDGAFNVLHYRAEDDWVEHCKAWESINDGIVRNNCYNNTLEVGKALIMHGISAEHPLIVMADMTRISSSATSQLFRSLNTWGIDQVHIMSEHSLGQLNEDQLSREESALTSFFVAMHADTFIGNSVSSFSALAILSRRAQGKMATYYNGGNIPLEEYLPFYKLSWVTTANDQMDTEYFQMLKTAIISGLRAGLRPYIVYQGDKDSTVHKWIRRMNVNIIYHELLIKSELIDLVKENRENHLGISHLYAKDESVIGTWQRIDIPILKELFQENFVLFTDCDVFFRKNLRLSDFPLPLPPYMGMASEADDVFPYNAGVILFNMLPMRDSYLEFVDWVLKSRNGLYYGPEFGPGDQGAYNKFYETNLRPFKLSQDFNAKPYHTFRLSAKIIHFHGPKVHDYLIYSRNNSCRFGCMCKDGLKEGGVCQYIDEIVTHNPAWHAASALKMHCDITRQINAQS